VVRERRGGGHWAGGLAAWAGRMPRPGGRVGAGPADMGRAEVADFLRSTNS
jgi:hypothetical protein